MLLMGNKNTKYDVLIVGAGPIGLACGIEAQRKGEIRQDIKPEFINFFLDLMVKLVNDPSLNKIYPDAQEMILELTNFFFYGILPRAENDSK